MRSITVGAVGAGVIISLTVVGLNPLSDGEQLADRVVIKTGYAFDVTDLPTLMENSTHVFVGRVDSVVSMDAESSSTRFRVKVLRPVIGSFPDDQVVVQQMGYVDEDGREYVAQSQPRLTVGADYLLTSNEDQELGVMVLVAGPLSARETAGMDVDRQAERYQDAERGTG